MDYHAEEKNVDSKEQLSLIKGERIKIYIIHPHDLVLVNSRATIHNRSTR